MEAQRVLWVELHDNAMVMRLGGRLVGTYANEVRSLVARCRSPFELVVDLSELTFIDALGEEVLSWMSLMGGEFIARSLYALQVCERLHLPLTGKFSQAHGEVRMDAEDDWASLTCD
jgi:hypothetical protein